MREFVFEVEQLENNSHVEKIVKLDDIGMHVVAFSQTSCISVDNFVCEADVITYKDGQVIFAKGDTTTCGMRLDDDKYINIMEYIGSNADIQYVITLKDIPTPLDENEMQKYPIMKTETVPDLTGEQPKIKYEVYMKFTPKTEWILIADSYISSYTDGQQFIFLNQIAGSVNLLNDLYHDKISYIVVSDTLFKISHTIPNGIVVSRVFGKNTNLDTLNFTALAQLPYYTLSENDYCVLGEDVIKDGEKVCNVAMIDCINLDDMEDSVFGKLNNAIQTLEMLLGEEDSTAEEKLTLIELSRELTKEILQDNFISEIKGNGYIIIYKAGQTININPVLLKESLTQLDQIEYQITGVDNTEVLVDVE